MRLGARAGYDSYNQLVTVPNTLVKSTALVNPEIVGILNTQDSGQLPTRGTRINGSLGWSSRDRSYPYMKSDFDHFHPLTNELSLFARGGVDTGFGRELSFYDQFTAGGLNRLDAYRYQEFRANSILNIGGGAIYRGLKLRPATFRPYLAAWHEVALLDLADQGWQTRQSTSMGIFAPTPLGIAGLILSFTEKGEARFRLSLGSFWNQP
jgi:outer membrane protein assembly factor BamA